MNEASAIILNPTANYGRDGRRWIANQRECLRRLAPAEVLLVESHTEAALAAKQSAHKGYQKLIVVGRGETAHGVVNGVMALPEALRRRIKVGFLGVGQPEWWSRTLDLPRPLDRQLTVLDAGHTLPCDVGQLTCVDESGKEVTRYFLNGAGFGLPSLIKREWRNPHTNIASTLVRIATGMRDLLGPQGVRLRLESEDGLLHEGRCVLGLVMGGRYYPGFGQVAPQAEPADGCLEMALVPCDGVGRTLARLAGVLLPRLAFHPQRPWRQVEQLKLSALNGQIWLEADGWGVGGLPASITVLRRALPVIVPSVAVRLRDPKRLAAASQGQRSFARSLHTRS